MGVRPLRVFHVDGEALGETGALPDALPATGFIWLAVARDALAGEVPALQAALERWRVGPLVDLHLSDLLNPQLPSHFDSTSWYDLLVVRRLALGNGVAALSEGADDEVTPEAARRALAAVDTSPVGFAVYDRVLLTVHPGDCAVREHFAARLATLVPAGGHDLRGSGRMPTSPADLMLRMVNHIVDSYLALRRLLTRQQAALQQRLLDPKSRFDDWPVLMESRSLLHQLEDLCEDQRSAVQEWIDALDEWPDSDDPHRQRERELLRVRSRDVLEHIERVLQHVRRLEQGAESAVQMHFSALGHRTNAIMRTLTVLTAVFLPLNLITGFFGMNFDRLPLIHSSTGVWVTIGLMVGVALLLMAVFVRKRYLDSSR